MSYSIRIHNYLGDLDDLHEVILAGPYEDGAVVNAEVNRLSGCITDGFQFEVSDLESSSMIDPQRLRLARTQDDVCDLIYLV